MRACGHGWPRPLTACAALVLATVPSNFASATGDHRARLVAGEQRILLLTNGRESLQNPDFNPPPLVWVAGHRMTLTRWFSCRCESFSTIA